MNAFTVKEIYIQNKTGEKLYVNLEPEGDCISVENLQRCQIVVALDPGEVVGSIEILCEPGMITIDTPFLKNAKIDGKT